MKIISIIGYDRSGTTFLGSYISKLGQNVFYAGEIDKAIKIIKEDLNENCSCGQQYFNCPVWSKLIEDIRDNQNIEFIINKIFKITNADVIIDTSKQLKFIKKVQKHFNDNHFTIHVKRNPKGVVVSRMNKRRRRVEKGTHPKPYIARNYNLMMLYDCLEWNFENLWMEFYKIKSRNLNLVYDKMENDLHSSVINFFNSKNIKLGQNHLENHILWGDKGRLNIIEKIVVNKEWKKQLNYVQKLSADALTYPIRFLFNYKF